MDMVGLLLIAASLSLFLLPLGLIRQSNRGFHNPSMVSTPTTRYAPLAQARRRPFLRVRCARYSARAHAHAQLGMITLGFLLFPLFIYYEARYPAKPVVPIRWFRRAPVMGACMIGFLDFVSFYLQYTYLYP